MDSAAAVLAVVLLEIAVGGLVILWASPTWGAVRHGYEILQSVLLGLLALAAWASIRGPLDALEVTAGAVELTPILVLATALAALASAALLLVRLPALGRIVGVLAAAVGLASLVPLAQARGLVAAHETSLALGVLELALGAFFLGAVWDGLILGHWYLVERRLSNRYMRWMSWTNVAAVVAGAATVALSARNPVPCAGLEGVELERCSLTYSPILSVGSFTVYMGAGMLLLVALIAGFNVKLAREGGRSIQAATGMSYLAVILAPAAEFAAKVRYF